MENVQSPEKVLAALAQLDATNDDHWTSDGLPKTAVVQRIAKDETIKRTDIQTVKPGFDRDAARAGQAQAEFEEPAAASGGPKESPPVADASGPKAGPPVAAEAETVTITDDQLRAHLAKRIADAEALIDQGRKTEAAGMNMQSDGMTALRQARADQHKYFPPATFSENVKAHIEASNAERARRVLAQNNRVIRPASQLDAARSGGNSRGWGRGHARGAYSRQEAARLGFKLPSGNPGVKA